MIYPNSSSSFFVDKNKELTKNIDLIKSTHVLDLDHSNGNYDFFICKLCGGVDSVAVFDFNLMKEHIMRLVKHLKDHNITSYEEFYMWSYLHSPIQCRHYFKKNVLKVSI